jgi:hypothetical protein
VTLTDCAWLGCAVGVSRCHLWGHGCFTIAAADCEEQLRAGGFAGGDAQAGDPGGLHIHNWLCVDCDNGHLPLNVQAGTVVLLSRCSQVNCEAWCPGAVAGDCDYVARSNCGVQRMTQRATAAGGWISTSSLSVPGPMRLAACGMCSKACRTRHVAPEAGCVVACY